MKGCMAHMNKKLTLQEQLKVCTMLLTKIRMIHGHKGISTLAMTLWIGGEN